MAQIIDEKSHKNNRDMLLSVTSNPTIDRTLYVPKLTVGEVQRTSAVHMAAGGKGKVRDSKMRYMIPSRQGEREE